MPKEFCRRTLPFWSMLLLNLCDHRATTLCSGGQLLPVPSAKCLRWEKCMGIGSGEKCHFHFELLVNNQARFLEVELLQIESV